jgi:hypothetical protein
MEMVGLIVDAVEEYDNTSDRPGTPSWITVDQLVDWLDKSNKLCEIDVYSIITKILRFIAHYGTPRGHRGLYIVAADTDTYVGTEDYYNEIFIATIPESWQAGNGNFDDFADKMEEARTKIDQLILDIILHHHKSDLEQKQITWMTNKCRLEDNLNCWFESNGYLPNSGTPIHELTSFDNIDDANPSVKLPFKAKANPQAASSMSGQNPLAKADTASVARTGQLTQYVGSHTEDSDAAPSPTSAGVTNTPRRPNGQLQLQKPSAPYHV